MGGIRTGVARKKLFWVHPTSFEAAVDVLWNAEFSFKAALFGTHMYNPNSANSFSLSDRLNPMDLSLAEKDEEAELQVVQQHRNV